MARCPTVGFLALQDLGNMLTLDIKKNIKQHSNDSIPNECCGLIIKNDSGYASIKCLNIASDSINYSSINPYDYLRASQLGKIVGMYHSQEDNEPSLLDNITSFEHNIPSIVYSRKSNKFYIVDPVLKSYLARPFNINKFDCLSLIRDYYNIELNIQINDYIRDGEWYKKTPEIIFDNFMKEGFEIVNNDIWNRHDLLLFGENTNKLYHMGIFIGKDMMLHHQLGGYSCIEYLNNHILSKLQLVLRHKLLSNYE